VRHGLHEETSLLYGGKLRFLAGGDRGNDDGGDDEAKK
jgi:hypothetical protein